MQLYSAYIYEANSSLLLNSETRIVIYYVLPSSGCVLASSLELWLLRYDDLLYFAWFVHRANKSSVCNRNNTPRSNLALASFSSILLWSRNMFRCFLSSLLREKLSFFILSFSHKICSTKDDRIRNANHRILSCVKYQHFFIHYPMTQGCSGLYWSLLKQLHFSQFQCRKLKECTKMSVIDLILY